MSNTEEGYVNTMREAAQSRLFCEIERQEYNLVSLLNLVPFRDGDSWCVLWGVNLSEGIAGFGDTPYLAILNFNRALNAKRGAA
ncbi:hypothetical protein A8B82_14845 [Sulfitobacter sp. EhC04]|uniref:hypothetical protein n=1 Tax=Sulfitobacter sp. EhC04 TaxID=1849168 RepID=UPI0007F51C11|nr:hypothetical protein [Sulfitobacter sp. EhC04]OAN76674.1 hypothetical protein A8B82_14845 [Sulfitobacter sp. EhC04]